VKDLLAGFHGEGEERAKAVKAELARHRREMVRAKAAWAKVYGGLPKVEEVPVAPKAKKRRRRRKK